MQIDIGALIAALLYEHDNLSIPALGTLIKTPTAVAIDETAGQARAASCIVELDTREQGDDGKLIARVQEVYSLSKSEAQQTVSHYVEEVKSALQRKETVVLPEVGRLFQDFQQQIRFISAGTNFNLDTFGLPEVAIQPLTVHTSQTVVASVDPEEEAPRSQWIRDHWPVLVMLLVFLAVLLGFLFFYPNFLQRKAPERATDFPLERLNVGPATENEDTLTQEADYDDLPVAEASEEGLVCIIAIGLFRDKQNVDQLVQDLMQAGYEPYLETLRSTTRVGAQFRYERSQEIDDKLQDIREKFAPDAFILRK